LQYAICMYKFYIFGIDEAEIPFPERLLICYCLRRRTGLRFNFKNFHVRGATFIQGGYRLDFYFLPLDRIALIQEAPGQLLDNSWEIMDTTNSI
jgi:hypothetical protein